MSIEAVRLLLPNSWKRGLDWRWRGLSRAVDVAHGGWTACATDVPRAAPGNAAFAGARGVGP